MRSVEKCIDLNNSMQPIFCKTPNPDSRGVSSGAIRSQLDISVLKMKVLELIIEAI